MTSINYLELIVCGESQHIEFKEKIDRARGHSVCAEIAAFASSGGGRIFIGICDDGNIVGLDEDSRTHLISRLQNWTAEKVSPQPKWKMEMLLLEGKHVLMVVVEPSDQPIHYYNGLPYYRVCTTSRPAGPGEVKDRFAEWGLHEEIKRAASLSTAAAFYGQNELATMSYDELVKRLIRDFPKLKS